MTNFTLGNLLRYRNRDWILVEKEDDVLRLRPLAGGDNQAVPISLKLAEALRGIFPEEQPSPSRFPAPTEKSKRAQYQDYLLFSQGARLILRDGVAPVRSLGRIGVRPRAYQLVPLLMALRLDPVRLLIADDVGVGKTIEAGLVARELLDRKHARRLAVIAPPHLLEQWVLELSTKFALDPVLISAGTLARLERGLPPGKSVYESYPVQVISIDFVKHDRHKNLFLQSAPDLIIVDEAHGVVGNRSATQRYELISRLSADKNRHMLLLTATPHSGIPEAFNRLLGLLNPEFENWDLSSLNEKQRDQLARHFVQRTRRDIASDWEGTMLFPKRKTITASYQLSNDYKQLYEEAHTYAKDIVSSSISMSDTKRRMRWWAALSFLRSIMSSPQSALAALDRRLGNDEELDIDALESFASQVYDASEAPHDDEVPSPLLKVIEEAGPTKLRRLKKLASSITPSKDPKLQGLLNLVDDEVLSKGHNPVIWCHFVDTAEYVGKQLRKAFPEASVAVVTGRMDGELRREAVEDLMKSSPRILVATDCVSEGINLQKGFSAVIHYDLPWNPNRLEQREGRVDRYGQPAEEVIAVRYRGIDNPIDQKVIDVLLKKADEIRNALGVYIPVFNEEKYVVDQMATELFQVQQRPLFAGEEPSSPVEEQWSIDKARERITRTKFAQRALKPQEVLALLEETDSVLGSPEQVKQFVLLAMQYLGAKMQKREVMFGRQSTAVWEIKVDLNSLPSILKDPLSPYFQDRQGKPKAFQASFTDPAPPESTFLGRSHPLVVALARHFFEGALLGHTGRWGAWKASVERATYLYLLRPRYLISDYRAEYLGEEVLVFGLQGDRPLSNSEVQTLINEKPLADVDDHEARELLNIALRRYEEHQGIVQSYVKERASEVREANRKLRRAAKDRVGKINTQAILPPDLLGVVILQPNR